LGPLTAAPVVAVVGAVDGSVGGRLSAVTRLKQPAAIPSRMNALA
jgi:hypothetical protein